jgi:transcriptional regulator with XRE-family HTH domain
MGSFNLITERMFDIKNDLCSHVKPRWKNRSADLPHDEGANPPARALLASIAAHLRTERERTGLSASALARRAGIAKSTLTQLEAGHGNPSVETLWALAAALGVPFARLIEQPKPPTRVIRAGEGVITRAEQANYTATLLAVCPSGPRHNVYRLELQPGAPRHADPHIPGTVEHLIVATGRAQVGLAMEPTELDAGDYITFPGDVPHVYEALKDDTTALLIMEYP